MRKLTVGALAISVILSISGASAATISAGSSCPKVNAKATSGGKSFLCTKVGLSLTWKTIATPSVKPTPTKPPAPKPVATQTASPTQTALPTPNPSTGSAQSQWKDLNSDQVIATSTAAINTYFATKRSPNAVVKVIAEVGVDESLTKWVTEGSALVSQSFLYPALTAPFYDVIASDRSWLSDTYTQLGYSAQQVQDRLGGFDSGSPAFGGATTNTWNMAAITHYNSMTDDKAGMAQTAGHEFFHAIQERYAGRNPGQDGAEIPNWFWEGPAMFVGLHSADQIGAINFATEGRSSMLNRYQNGFPQTRALDLKDVSANNGTVDPYAIGFAATELLVAQVGMDKFINVYAELGKGRTFEVSFQNATGIALSDFYSHFEKIRASLGFPKS